MMINLNSRPIYLDYHSTTPVDSRVAEVILHYMTTAFGNASSVDHDYGNEANQAILQARKYIAELINARPQEIIFTSGATESINLTIQGTISKQNYALPCIAISPVEHKAVIDTCEALQKKNLIKLIYFEIDTKGQLDIEFLEQTCKKGLSLLCIMAANNEVGTVYPIQQIGQIAQKYNIPFLCDASQTIGKIPINFEDWGITYLAISGHKLYGPKGIGALVIKQGHHLEPVVFGGGQQKGLRPGTLNVSGIVGLGEACRLRLLEMEKDESAIAVKRDKLQSILHEKIPNLVINGDLQSRLAGNLHISIPDVPNSAIIARVRHKLAISTGSACSSGTPSPSHVLRAMQLPENITDGAIRIGIGKFTTDEEIEQAAAILEDAINQVRRILSET